MGSKKHGLMKSLILVAVIFFGLHWITDGESTQYILDLLDGSSTSTASTQATTSPAQRLPGMPESLYKHVYLHSRDNGPCTKFTGNVTMLVIFVDDPEATWTDGLISDMKEEISATVGQISEQAESYGAQVQITTEYLYATSGIPLVRDEWSQWANSALQSVSIDEPHHMLASYLEEKYQSDNVPVVFLTNQSGRAFSNTASGTSLLMESALLYKNTDALFHEVCHIFGAEDFYFPDEVTDLANQYLPDSIMVNSRSGIVDPLTAYLIGWTDELSEDALQFLQETAYLTPEYLSEQKKIDSYTGYAENYAVGTGSYTGYLVNGIRHGQGKYTAEDGSTWEGTYAHGLLQGQVKYNGHNGDRYTGAYVDGERHGQGTYIWADGSKYVGNYQNGVRSGQGTMYYSDGNIYVGQWKNGQRSGQGKLTLTDGKYCEGQWADDTLNGRGTFYWSKNEKYVGHFVDGKRSGYGVYYFPSGNRYEGQWKNGERHGQGTMYYANGTKQSGKWSNGSFVG